MPAENPVPAILEHLPYRKRDGTTARDSLTHPYFAGHGYACVRVDMRGNGDSEGLMDDEYSEQELQDAVDVIAWLAAQPWCSGKVGMMGISWGGFNCAAGRREAAAGAEGDHHAVLDRRPLCRRHPLQGRPAAQREHGLGRDHAVLFVAAAGPGAGRRQQMARHVARPAGARAVPAGGLAEASAPRRLLEARLGLRGFFGDQGRDAGDRRLGRRLQERRLAPGRRHRGAGQGHRRAVDPQIPAFRRAQAGASASCRRRCAGGTAG